MSDNNIRIDKYYALGRSGKTFELANEMMDDMHIENNRLENKLIDAKREIERLKNIIQEKQDWINSHI